MTTKTTENGGFLMVFWSFWVLGPILAHQTAKFELSGQFRFSRHPWGPWERQSSGVICIWKIYQLFCDSGAALADFFTSMKMLPNVSFISMAIKKVFLSVSIATISTFLQKGTYGGIIMEHLNQNSVSVKWTGLLCILLELLFSQPRL